MKGVAQGLLYLHKHSRLRVIHRSLKASNILLDQDMNSKIQILGLQEFLALMILKETQRGWSQHMDICLRSMPLKVSIPLNLTCSALVFYFLRSLVEKGIPVFTNIETSLTFLICK
ncbi:Receptor-like serine/threonine-protein kinase SD1-7 [Dichanthelium oligosanthes]|uniref:non-specific serine/threonine protein kinase n=1 Tax=Dichanthelium oligosanthes TaxID=888268 RepID=A0A1E5WG81_9POAL|nr:Receptor-like serine/threonine-protein kinase SD1-7 [Dichanthelium oligosanthes]